MKKTYEVEIKSLLKLWEEVENLKKRLWRLYPDLEPVSRGSQLNHYFNLPPDFSLIKRNIKNIIPKSRQKEFEYMLSYGKNMSIRTRDADNEIIFVIKASVDDNTSSNGVKRLEFESVVNKSLSELDTILIKSGCTYQAKWSRERQEFRNGQIHVCFDRNAGYGYVVEFEKLVSNVNLLEKTRKELLKMMEKLEVKELPQSRLERMFNHYNKNWIKYYGTNNVFNIR